MANKTCVQQAEADGDMRLHLPATFMNKLHRVVRMNITIRELAQGWLWAERGRHYKHAVGALRAVRREAKAIVKADPRATVLQIIEWEPQTAAGRLVAKALAQP